MHPSGMKQKLMTIAVGLALVLMTGALTSCENKHEKLVKNQIAAMNAYADEYESNPKSGELAKIDARLAEISDKMANLDAPSKAQEEQLQSEYQEELKTALDRYMNAKMQGQMGGVMKGLQDAMKGFR